MGIKFYPGASKMCSMMHTYLERESCSLHDHNSIRVELKFGDVLGHLESEIAPVLAPFMDRNIAGFLIKTYNMQLL